jgi:peptidoglycan/LPS O-acetylase OafA/YrhL
VRDLPLEALRGLASIIVLLAHTMMAFYPCLWWGGGPSCSPGASLLGEPWFFVFNGISAVAFFFVLSGFVLTRAYFASYDHNIIVRGALKRWPRLAGPVLVSVLASWLLASFGLYYAVEAGRLMGNEWLAFEGGNPDTSFARALAQGLFTFVRGDSNFDMPIWSMRVEFAGTYIAFGIAILLLLVRQHPWPVISLYVAPILFIFHGFAGGRVFVPFIVGAVLARFLPQQKRLSPWIAAPVVLVSLYFLGFLPPGHGSYAWLGNLLSASPFQVPANYIHLIGASALIVVVELCPAARWPLSGPVSRFVGELSFPLYLIHLPVIMSIGSFCYLSARSLPHAQFLAAATSVGIALLAAVPLMWFNRWWLKVVNRNTELLAGKPAMTFWAVKAAPESKERPVASESLV